MNFFEHLSYFFNVSRSKQFSTTTQITYLHILWKWNCLRQPALFQLSDAELSTLTGLERHIITAEKRRLQNLGFIKFKSKHGAPTKYSILARQPQNENSGEVSANDEKNDCIKHTHNTINNIIITNSARGGKLSESFSF